MLKITFYIAGMILILNQTSIAEHKIKLTEKELKYVHGRKIANSPGESAVILNPNGKYNFGLPKATDFTLKQKEYSSIGFNKQEGNTLQIKVFEK